MNESHCIVLQANALAMLKHIIFITFWGLIPEITKFTQWAYYNVELKFYMLEI